MRTSLVFLVTEICYNWEHLEDGMNGCPDTGCKTASTLEAAKELCIADESCNGVLQCPYNNCNQYEIRRGPNLTPNVNWNQLEDVHRLTRYNCNGNF